MIFPFTVLLLIDACIVYKQTCIHIKHYCLLVRFPRHLATPEW